MTNKVKACENQYPVPVVSGDFCKYVPLNSSNNSNVLNASNSYDPDNGDPPSPGQGITDGYWEFHKYYPITESWEFYNSSYGIIPQWTFCETGCYVVYLWVKDDDNGGTWTQYENNGGCYVYVVSLQITDLYGNEITTLQTKTVGEKVELHTELEPSGLQASWQWSSNQYAVGGYEIDGSGAHTTNVTTNQSQVQFYWAEQNQSSPYTNSVTVSCTIGGTQFTDSVVFEVEKPTFSNNNISYGTIAIYNNALNSDNGSARGIFYSVHVVKSSGLNGTVSNGALKFVQLLQEYEELTGTSTNYSMTISPFWWCDTVDPFGDTYSFNSTQNIGDNDTPHQELNISFTYLAVDQHFVTFVMYKSNVSDSIWVPIAKMEWDWYAEAQSNDGGYNWFLVPNSYGHQTGTPEFGSTSVFPEYSDIATTTNPEWEEE
jgi:hypothetical protein